MRVVECHNALASKLNDRILLADGANPPMADGATPPSFSQQYPKLGRLIERLDFISEVDVRSFSFACGLYSEYCDARRSSSSPTQVKNAFFQKYFLTKGSDQGIADLHLFWSCDILYQANILQLHAALENIDVECCSFSAPEASANAKFDFPMVYTVVVKHLGFGSGIGIKLKFPDGYNYELLFERNNCAISETKVMILLHEFAKRGGSTTDLLKPLEELKRRDLSEKLERALRDKGVLSSGSPHPMKKSKHW